MLTHQGQKWWGSAILAGTASSELLSGEPVLPDRPHINSPCSLKKPSHTVIDMVLLLNNGMFVFLPHFLPVGMETSHLQKLWPASLRRDKMFISLTQSHPLHTRTLLYLLWTTQFWKQGILRNLNWNDLSIKTLQATVFLYLICSVYLW